MEPRHIYTSTGLKFWRHPGQMVGFLQKNGRSVISTHISPEGSCNLSCSYCSVSKRDRHERIELGTIDRYVNDLRTRGLKAVILTGGGEPTIYPEFNELVHLLGHYAYEYDMKFGLITNGVDLQDHGKDLDLFDWVRISVNNISDIYSRINLYKDQIKDDCTVGMSLVFDGKNKELTPSQVSRLANNVHAQYIRVLPNCLPEDLDKAHMEIQEWIMSEPSLDNRFFQQFKYHGAPQVDYCPQAYFRPYLSEVGGGTVFPCDSVVLNNKMAYFNSKWAICKASQVLDFMDNKITQRFDPRKDCTGCVFFDNVTMLDEWTKGLHRFHIATQPLKHEDFV